ncbi:hypothetical protein QKW52_18330 [Bacillus sonorensis]|nr:hypothetical protein [Bacillus sonorensis]
MEGEQLSIRKAANKLFVSTTSILRLCKNSVLADIPSLFITWGSKLPKCRIQKRSSSKGFIVRWKQSEKNLCKITNSHFFH